MEKEKSVTIEQGEIVLQKPTAGIRNNAALKSFADGSLNEIKFLLEILPHCIKSHPFGQTPIRSALDSMSIEDYDKLVDVLKLFMGVSKGDIIKKSD